MRVSRWRNVWCEDDGWMDGVSKNTNGEMSSDTISTISEKRKKNNKTVKGKTEKQKKKTEQTSEKKGIRTNLIKT